MSKKAISFKKTNEIKKIQACKKGLVLDAIGRIEKNTDTFCLTFGQFSLIDALMAVLDQTGPAHVIMSTWTAAHADLTRSAELMASAEILSLRLIVDRSFKTRQPAYHAHMVDLFGHESIRAINTHAKFVTVRNDKFDIVIRTSMNLNGNPRLENIEISENREFADFFEKVTEDIFKEIAPDERKHTIPDLKSVPESRSFPLIESNPIKKGDLNEPSYTHEMD